MKIVDTGLIQMVDVDLGLIECAGLRHRTNLRLTSPLTNGSESLHLTSFGPGGLNVSPHHETRMLTPQLRA